MRRLAALAAMLALALNLVALRFGQAHPVGLDAFGNPICSEHLKTEQSDLPTAPANEHAACEFCCTVSVAFLPVPPVLPVPSTIEWTQPAVITGALHLPSPSRHLLGPPRGPPLA